MKGNSVSVLLVEDDDVDAMSVTRAFKKLKVVNPLHRAENGLQALNKLRGAQGEQKLTPTPKIIMLDINMPRMNGLEFLHELRNAPALRPISVVVLTTSNEDRDKIAAYDFNVAGYILKPVEPDKFLDAISTLNLYWTLIELPSLPCTPPSPAYSSSTTTTSIE